MPFPRRLLCEGEEIALELRPHWSFFVGPLAAGVPLLALLVGTLRLEGDAETGALWAFAAAAAAWALWLAARLARWTTTHFVVTTDRLIHRRGVLTKHSRDIPLERINDIASSRTLLERLIGAGDLLIESAGERGQQMFSDIPHPDRVQQEIYRQVERNADRAVVAGGRSVGAATPSVPEQIVALAGLRDEGLLTDAEFEAKKTDLLQRM